MSTSTYGKKFGFLDEWKIHEAIGANQQGLHTTKTKNSKEVVAKIDIAKSYDMVNWMYLRLILSHPV